MANTSLVVVPDYGIITQPTWEELDGNSPTSDSHPNFLEGNSQAISFHDLRSKCIVPTWANNQLTISHQHFIQAVSAAAYTVFGKDMVKAPEIRVSHAVQGRTPNALMKKPSELLDSEKTLYYQRMSFCIAVSMMDTINGNETNIVVGGVRALNNENLGSRQTLSKVKVFCGEKVKVCSNLCVFGTNYIDKLEVASESEIYTAAVSLFSEYNQETSKHQLEILGQTTMTTEDFTHIIGRMRLYEALSTVQRQKLGLPGLILGDQTANSAVRNFVVDKNFGIGNGNEITLWAFYNLLTEANKNAYIDRFLAKSVNATDFSFGIAEALQGKDTPYKWFIQ